MTRELERAGIPTVHITNLTAISEGIGPNRIFRGHSVTSLLGDPSLSPDDELNFRTDMLERALSMLENN